MAMVWYGRYNYIKTVEYSIFRTLNGCIVHNYSNKKVEFKLISYHNENL